MTRDHDLAMSQHATVRLPWLLLTPTHSHTHTSETSAVCQAPAGAAAPQKFSSLNTVVALLVGETVAGSLEGRRCSDLKADSSYFTGKEAGVSQLLDGVIRECSFFVVLFFFALPSFPLLFR